MLELLALLMGGTVAGTVTLNGPAPPMEWLKRTSDPFCAQTRMRNEEEVVGNLGNVLVHVVGAPASSPPPEAHVIEQRDCMYRPRMSGMVFGQRVEIVNRDPTLHNVHTYVGTQTQHCQAQVPGHNFKQRPNVMVKLKCDVHQWMGGYLWIQDNSLFAVSGENGWFVIKNVPPGIWTVETWHERLGARTATVLVLPWVAARVDFRY